VGESRRYCVAEADAGAQAVRFDTNDHQFFGLCAEQSSGREKFERIPFMCGG
jgi:hypothetical protein